MNPKELIDILKEQHKMLKSNLDLALENSKLETKESLEGVILSLNKFRSDLLAHVKLEDEEFYPDYFNKKNKRGESLDTGEKFVNEMKAISKVIFSFLDKYPTVESIQKSIPEFRRELNSIAGTLSVRVETEEEGLFDFYLMM